MKPSGKFFSALTTQTWKEAGAWYIKQVVNEIDPKMVHWIYVWDILQNPRPPDVD